MKLVHWLASVLGLFATLSGTAFAQVTTGTPPFGSFGGGPVDTVNLANLNVHLTIPVLNKPGRGIPFVYTITYDNSIWYPVTSNGTSSWQPTGAGSFGFSFEAVGNLKMTNIQSAGYCYTQLPPPWGNTITGWIFTWSDSYYDLSGTPHLFPGLITEYTGTCGSAVYSYPGGTAADGSGYSLAVSSTGNATVTASSGQLVYWTNSSGTLGVPVETDTNGNEISLNSSGVFTDTLGKSALTVSGTAPNSTTFTYTIPGGGSQASYTMKYESVTLKSNFGCSGIAEYGPTQQYLVSEIDRPDAGAYTFNYEPTPGYSGGVTGRLASVTLPTGGVIYYTYSGGSNGITCADGSTATLQRQTPDGSWTYNHAESGTAWTTWITDPLGNGSTLNFQGIYLTQARTWQGSTLEKTTYTCYNGNGIGTPSNCYSVSITSPITRQTTFLLWPTNQESETDTTYDSTGYGLVKEVDGYDYGSSAPGVLIGKTLTTYASLGNGIVDLPSSVTVQNSSGTPVAQTLYYYDQTGVVSSGITTQHVSVSGSRGNLTTVTSLVSGSTYVSPTSTYFDTGMVNVAKDGKGNPTTYTYSSNYAGAYPTTITNALNQSTTYVYDINSGLQTSVTDPNNQVTSSSYDSMMRPLTVNHPDGGQTTFTYDNPTQFHSIEKMNTSGGQRVTYVQVDGVGRPARTAVSSGEFLVYDETSDICYSPDGLVSFMAYAFQDDGWNGGRSCGIAGDSYTYDALSRITKVAHADGSNISASYSGPCVTVTDEQGKTRESCTDGAGRMTSLIENPGGLNYTTAYTYDVLNDLTSVLENGSHQRTFVYDGLSRLTSGTNPETSNTAYTYTYDAASNIQTRKDARGITTTYAYDALNRLTSKTYSDGVTPGSYYYYDQVTSWWGVSLTNTIGRLSTEGVYNGSQWLSASCFSRDPMGRVINNSQATPLNVGTSVYPVSIAYDLVGDMTSYTNGAGVTLSQAFNAAGLPTQLTSSWVDSQHPATIASNLHYIGNGAAASASLGNGLAQSAAFNGLLQPCRLNVNSSGTLVSSCAAGVPSGNLLDLSYGFNYGSGDNGNLMSWSASGQQSFSRSYTYDQLNRLSTMSAPGNTCSGLSWTYDAWGNRTAQSATGGTCNTSALTINSNNQMASPYQYDANGNLTYDGVHNYTYDAENRITKVDTSTTYSYDADGNRVSKVVSGVETDYVRDLSGNVLVEYGGGCGSTCANAQYSYLNGQLTAMYQNSTTYFFHPDHLGSTRLMTAMNGSIYENIDYLPFGEQITGTSNTTHKFTGYERDAESGNDYAMARYDSSRLGRFMSPDPVGNAIADPTNPQSWNMYAYVNNNPLAFTDPSGMDDCDQIAAPGAGGGCVDFNYGWEGNFGFGTSYTMDGAAVPPNVAQGALGAGAACDGGCTSTVTGNNGLPYTIVHTAGPTVFEGPNGEEISNSSLAEVGFIVGTASGLPPNLPAGTPQQFWGPFLQGFNAALKDVNKKKCKAFYGGNGAATMKATSYRFLPLSNPNVGAETTGLNVFINENGPYMTYDPPIGQPGAFGQIWTQPQFRAFILLHELGHEMSSNTGFQADGDNLALNTSQSKQVINACF